MSLKEQLVADLKVALQEKDASRALVIRYLRNAIQYREKDVGKELEEAAVMEILARQVRERRESIAAFEAGQRHDLVEKERAELAILEVYMPEQLSQDKISGVGPASSGRGGGYQHPRQGQSHEQAHAPNPR